MKSTIFPLLLIAFSSYACSGNQPAQQESTPEETAEVSMQEDVESENFGMEFTTEGVVKPSEFLAMMEGKDSLAVKLEASISACCQKKGCWMDLDMENGTSMKVRFKDYGFFVPMDSEGKKSIIAGTAYLSETPVDELKHYAEDAGKSQEEIDAITEPELAYTFIADGVIIDK